MQAPPNLAPVLSDGIKSKRTAGGSRGRLLTTAGFPAITFSTRDPMKRLTPQPKPGHQAKRKPAKALLPYCYEYPRPAVAVDLVVTRLLAGQSGKIRELLLIQRGQDPFAGCWALPGGFLEMEETLEAAAARELREETGVRVRRLVPLGAFSEVDRDPRGRVISFAYWSEVARTTGQRAGDDASAAAWFPVAKLPKLAFDHSRIIAAAGRVWSRGVNERRGPRE
jgi:8-oxo-dGTP diphosphatase